MNFLSININMIMTFSASLYAALYIPRKIRSSLNTSIKCTKAVNAVLSSQFQYDIDCLYAALKVTLHYILYQVDCLTIH